MGMRFVSGVGFRAALVVATVSVSALGFASQSLASTAGFNAQGALEVAAFPGERNTISIGSVEEGRGLEVRDMAGVSPGEGCRAVSSTMVTCPYRSDVLVSTGDEDDRVSETTGGAITIRVGTGNDFVQTKPSNSRVRIFGEDGRDELIGDGTVDGGGGDDDLSSYGDAHMRGGEGADLLQGGTRDEGGCAYVKSYCRDDFLDGGPGPDVLSGGGGARDIANYTNRDRSVEADIDGDADDGESGEGDRIASDVEGIWSGLGDDRLTGSAVSNSLVGGGGADVLVGLAGDDVIGKALPGVLEVEPALDAGPDEIDGGDGDDDLFGGGGVDRLNGGPGDDDLEVAHFDDADARESADGGEGSDTVDYSSRKKPLLIDLPSGQAPDDLKAIENIIGGYGDDTLIGGDESNAFNGWEGNDHLVGGDGDDRLEGEYGADTADGGGGADEVDGGSSNDEFSYRDDSAGDTLDGGPGDDRLNGGSAGRSIFCTKGCPDYTIDGSDLIRGGDGRDTVTYDRRRRAVVIDLVAGSGGEPRENDRLEGLENASGGESSDLLRGDGGSNALMGGNGNDTLEGAGGEDVLAGGPSMGDVVSYGSSTGPVVASLDGKPNDGGPGEHDTIELDVEDLIGGSGDDKLVGDERANTLDGGAGSDLLGGGDGEDTVTYRSRLNRVVADLDGMGDDGAVGEADTIAVDVENLTGGKGDDRLSGDEGPNHLRGGGGADQLAGGGGVDRLRGGDGRDRADGGEGGDIVFGNRGADRLLGSAGLDTLDGGAENDRLMGGRGADRVDGRLGSDGLWGGSGADSLRGDSGRDRYSGGGGRDLLVTKNLVRETADCGGGFDSIFADRSDRLTACERVSFTAQLSGR